MSLIRILKSRFQKETDEEFVKLRREICEKCLYSTRFTSRNTLRLKLSKALSDFYSFITMSENDDLYECSICTCALYYKTRIPEEQCEKGKWKSIYIPNKK